jgi:hypothetical protein
MVKRIKSFMAVFVTMLTLCAFAMPVICSPAHAMHDQSSSVSSGDLSSSVTMKADTTKDTKQHKAGDSCCISHHCCSAKLAAPTGISLPAHSASSLLVGPYINQNIYGLDIHGLDRPPKNLA